MTFLVTACALLAAPAWEADLTVRQLSQFFGSVGPVSVAGNGGLTLAVSPYGQLAGYRWPSPSYHDQLGYRVPLPGEPSEKPLGRGAMWGLRIEGKTAWLTGPPWRLVAPESGSHAGPLATCVSRWEAAGIAARQEAFVAPDLDVAVLRIAFRASAPESVAVFWYQDFDPCTRLVPGMPIAGAVLDELNDFAAFTGLDADRVYHFRPRRPGAEDWAHARRLAERGRGGAEWNAFEGAGGAADVWVGTASPNRVIAVQCANEEAADSALRQAEAGGLGGRSGAAGQCASALRLQPEPLEEPGWHSATVFISCGRRREEVDGLLDHALALGAAGLRSAHQVYWRKWLERAELPEADGVSAGMHDALRTIATATDRATGGVVWAPLSQPPLGWVSARQTAWAALALDMAGLHEQAGRCLAFYVDANCAPRGVRPGSPPPAAVYADGTEAAPPFVADAAGAGWILAACWRHVETVAGTSRRGFLASIQDHVVSLGDFLAAWSEGPAGGTLPDFSPGYLRDMPEDEQPVAMYMGLTAATRLLETGGQAVPEHWARRQRGLLTGLQLRLVRREEALRLPLGLPFYLDGVIAPPRADQWDPWDAPVQTENGPIPMSEVAFPCSRFLEGSEGHSWAAAMRLIALHLCSRTEEKGGGTGERPAAD